MVDEETYLEAYRARRRQESARARERAAEIRALGARLADLCRAHGATRVVLFGSAARGATRAGGDIDLAVDGVPPARFFDLYGKLILASPIPVDLIDLADCRESLRARIGEEGVEL